MVHIRNEGKFDENSTLLDAEFLKTKKTCAVYVIENEGKRMMIDTGEALSVRRIVKKLKKFDLFPIHKIFLTHAHWDHIQGIHKLQRLMKVPEIEVYASIHAIEVLKHPEGMNEYFGYNVKPIEDVIPLKEGDIINLNGLCLKVYELFGHTPDSIALADMENKNIFVGDALIDRIDENTYIPVLFGPSFNESLLLKTFDKIRKIQDEFDSVSLAHYGVWKGSHCDRLINEMEDQYHLAKNSIIRWYEENPSPSYITKKYQEELIPNSQIFTKESLMGLQWNITQNIDTLKAAGFLE
ncbi:MAG: MBL fold metallo-hydrolase [Candidatus Lokiarchaeota archaeon]|nr:MBL fold metallo-hydrolase [Candidatus Lokiarchaeota archaeon]MBD3201101.1 MBL fold metallo-hydrolase [Candidatus Lokiarchaeota archaeon]